MSSNKIFLLGILGVCATWIIGCKSEPQNPYPQGYPQQTYPQQGYPQALPGQQGQPMQQAQPMQQPQPLQQAQPAQQGQPAAQGDPMAGLAGALGQAMGQAMGQAPAGQQGAVQMINWQSLGQALPTAAPGWALDGQVEGESANMFGISVSTARCNMKQGNMNAKVEIVDTSMNPMMAMPFNMARSVQVDSSTERRGPTTVGGTYPATQSWNKQTNEAEIMAMVHNRVMVTVKVTNAASEAPATQLANSINWAHIASLIGG